MYLPEHFREERSEVLHAFIRRHPLGALVAVTTEGLTANHIPMELEGGSGAREVLRGHIARANPLWRTLTAPASVLVIFGGANRYITPSWYATKRDSGEVVPTWNYSVVHARGSLRFIQEPGWIHALVSRLTDQHEMSRAAPWKVTDAPSRYIEKMVDAIVGFEIAVDSITGKFKASQNRSEVDREGVRRGLGAGGPAGEDGEELLRSPQSPRRSA